jgi:hypothetical protein
MPGISDDAWMLLVVRLRNRMRAVMWMVVVMLVGFTVDVAALGGDGPWSRIMEGAWTCLFLAVAVQVPVRSDRRSSAKIIQQAGLRASRGRQASFREVAGVRRVLAYGVMVVAQAVFVVTVCTDYPLRYSGQVAAGFVCVWLAVASVVWIAMRRPAIALDGPSLAVDERLRFQDAGMGLVFMYFAATGFAFILESDHHARVDLYGYAFLLQGLGLVAQLVGTLPRKWPNPYYRVPRWSTW